MTGDSIVAVDQLVKRFRTRARSDSEFTAVDRVSFRIHVGETLGLVGETGAGKSTIARCVLGLDTPSSGRIELFGHDAAMLNGRGWKRVRRDLQAVFQDPKGAMDPRWSVEELVGEPLHRLTEEPSARIGERVGASLQAVGLGPEFLGRFRHQLSGGQQQRVNIARAIAVSPRCIVLDEPVAALDTNIKRDIVTLLRDLQRERKLTYLLISHDLRVVRILCRRVIVLFRGRIVEMGPTDVVTETPRHPYTQQLLAAEVGLSAGTIAVDQGHAVASNEWSLEEQDDSPHIGDLLEVAPGHFVAQAAPVRAVGN